MDIFVVVLVDICLYHFFFFMQWGIKKIFNVFFFASILLLFANTFVTITLGYGFIFASELEKFKEIPTYIEKLKRNLKKEA